MGDELVSTRSTQSERGGGEKRPASLFAYTEEFERSFPYYLAIGMTYEQYWEQDSTLVRAYRKAAKIQRDLRNQDAWLQGAYFYEALCDAAPIFRAFAKKGTKATPYRDGPFEFKTNTEKPEERKSHEEKQDEKAKSYMEMLAISLNEKFMKKTGGDTNG